MEKYGIEQTEQSSEEKQASEKKSGMCKHPKKYLREEGDTIFCEACGKYINIK